MGVDLPNSDIQTELNKPQSQEVVSVGECKTPDFQAQFDELQTQTKEKTTKLQEEMQYSDKQKQVLRKIYCGLPDKTKNEDGEIIDTVKELRKAIENQSVKIFDVPNRDLVALSVDGMNVDYLYNLEGKLIVDMLANLNEEFLPYYTLNMREVGYELSFENGVAIFTPLKKEKAKTDNDFIYTVVGTPINKSNIEYYDILIEGEKIREKVINTLEGILKERGVNVNAFKKFPDYKGSKVEKAVEEGTIEVKKIPGREAIAVYEYNQGNLIYLTNLKGEPYINVDHFRTVQMLSDIFEAGYLRQGYSRIENVDGLWKLYSKDGKEIPISSDEYATATLNAINLMLDFSDYIYDEAQSKGLIK